VVSGWADLCAASAAAAAAAPLPSLCRLKLFCRLSKLLRASDMDADLLSAPGAAIGAPPSAAPPLLPPGNGAAPVASPGTAPASDQSDCERRRCSNMEARLLPPPPPWRLPPGVLGREPALDPGPPPSPDGRMLPADMRVSAGSWRWSREDLVRL
jgi:hypothetical protein